MLITLTVGDWSGDGHEKTEKYTCEFNLPIDKIEKAYKKGCKKLGFDLRRDVAADYEDRNISKDLYDKLVEAGYSNELDSDIDSLTADDFVLMWVFIAKLGNPELKCSFCPTESLSNINVGGYGLFY